MSGEEAEQYLDRLSRHMGEHFDAIQIMVSWTQDGLTYCAKRGAGNWYARQGMAHEFINQDVAQDNAREIAKRLNPPNDGEEWKKT